MASANQTRDHDEIRRWAEARGGIPTFVKGTHGLLRIDFVVGEKSHGREASLEEVSWDEWFRVFDDNGLTFLFSPEDDSKFFKLISEKTAEANAEGGHTGGRTERRASSAHGAPQRQGRKRSASAQGRREGRSTGQQHTVRVTHEEDAWHVMLDGSDQRHSYRTKQDAVHHGRELAHRHEPCELLIERFDGEEDRRYEYQAHDTHASH